MKKIIVVLNFFILMIALFACGRNLPADEAEVRTLENQNSLTPLRVAVQQYYISSSIGYVMEHGLDEQFGIKLIPVEYPSGAEQIVDIEKDIYDVATIGAAFLYPLVENKGVVIGEHIRSTGGNAIYTRVDSEILDVKGFNPTYPEVCGDYSSVKDKTILMKGNTTQEYLGMKWLESIGVKRNSVKLMYGDFQGIYERFLTGEGDVIALSAPYSYQAQKDGLKKIADEESLHTEIYEVLLATKKSHEEKKEELVQFMKCLLYANEILESDFQAKTDAAQRWYTKQGNPVTKDILMGECRDKILVTSSNYDSKKFGEFEMKYAEYMAAIGNISPLGLPNVEKNIDRELFKKAFQADK